MSHEDPELLALEAHMDEEELQLARQVEQSLRHAEQERRKRQQEEEARRLRQEEEEHRTMMMLATYQDDESYDHNDGSNLQQEDDDNDDDPDLQRALRESSELATAAWQRQQDELELAMQIENSVQHAARIEQVADDVDLAAALHLTDAVDQSWQDELTRVGLTAAAALSQQQQHDAAAAERHAGSWECPVCTYSNEPYQSPCGACEQAAPPHVLVFAPIPSNLRFGVELELIVTNGVRDGYSCEWMARQLTGLEVPTQYAGYSHAVTDHWKIVTDSSVSSANRHDLCCELVSPVLVGDAGLAQVRLLLESVRRLGIDINHTCGFHLHVDAEQGPLSSLPGLQRLVQCFVALEGAFDEIVARDASQHASQRRTNRNRYCRSNRLAFGESSNKSRWNQIGAVQSVRELVQLVNPGYDRYRKLNVTNLTKPSRPGTVEFRQHGGVRELLSAESWLRLIMRFCHHAANCVPASLACRLPEHATVTDELKALFLLVDCPGLEAYFMLERRLYAVPETSRRAREWKCHDCGRCFRNSRSLAQHCSDTGHVLHR